MTVDAEQVVHHGFHGLERNRCVDNRSESRCHRADKIGACEHAVAQRRAVFAVFYTCKLDDVADFDIGRACHLASLAIEAIFQRFVVEVFATKAQSFSVGTGLLRSGIFGAHGNYRAVGCASRAFEALLKIVCAYIFVLHFHYLLSVSL